MDVKKFITNGRLIQNFLKVFLTPIQLRILKMQSRKTLIRPEKNDHTKIWETTSSKTKKELTDLFKESSSSEDEVCLLNEFYMEDATSKSS